MRALTLVTGAGLAGLMLVACGSAVPTVLLTEQDGGHTLTTTVGATVEIQLTDWYSVPGSSLTWQATSSAPSVLTPVSTSLDPPLPANSIPRGTYHYRAYFRAAATGQAQISALGRLTCEAMNPAYCHGTSVVVTVLVK